MPDVTINDVMAAYAEDAVDFARQNFGVMLDFSAASIERVESMANRLYESRPKGVLGRFFKQGPSDKDVEIICKMLGGYIGEVYRRAKGGEWGINEQFDAIGVVRGESWLFPPAKVHKRLTNGAEDNLWSYFQIVLEEPWEAR